jgi:hypothetical protein
MWHSSQRLVWTVVLLAAISGCGEDASSGEQAGRPASFGDECTPGMDNCRDPFACLAIQDFSSTQSNTAICTLTCQKNEDCPTWHEPSGACAGENASQCLRQVCLPDCP